MGWQKIIKLDGSKGLFIIREEVKKTAFVEQWNFDNKNVEENTRR